MTDSSRAGARPSKLRAPLLTLGLILGFSALAVAIEVAIFLASDSLAVSLVSLVLIGMVPFCLPFAQEHRANALIGEGGRRVVAAFGMTLMLGGLITGGVLAAADVIANAEGSGSSEQLLER